MAVSSGRVVPFRLAIGVVLPLCLVAATVLAGAAWGGTVKGTVRFVGGSIEEKTLPVTRDQFVCGREKPAQDLVLSADRGIRNAVVSFQVPPAGSRWEAPLSRVQMDQQQCVFVPRVVIVPVGGTVEFLSSDRLLHNLHSASQANRFNRTQPKGRTIPITMTKPETFRLDCDLHPWMRAWVVVAEHPYYTVTNDDGEFVFTGVPPGRYVLQVWQERLGTVTREVTVTEMDAASVTVEMKQ